MDSGSNFKLGPRASLGAVIGPKLVRRSGSHKLLVCRIVLAARADCFSPAACQLVSSRVRASYLQAPRHTNHLRAHTQTQSSVRACLIRALSQGADPHWASSQPMRDRGIRRPHPLAASPG